MSPETVLYIIFAGIVSIGISVFMYAYKAKYSVKLTWTLAILRTFTIFAVLLLLINPKFTATSYITERPKLPIFVDNSISIAELSQGDNVNAMVDILKTNRELNDKFEVSFFSFGNTVSNDSLTFSESNTNISEAIRSGNQLFKNDLSPLVLITDGNQTLGTDYEFVNNEGNKSIYPIIAGDNTEYTDLKIEQLNSNRYAYLKNQFPLETILVYNGEGSVKSEFVILKDGKTVYREAVSFSKESNTKVITTKLEATSVGLQTYTASITPIADEKNRINNSKRFAVEVIDEATNILIVSNIRHPDVGTLKKSIATNEKRRVEILAPESALQKISENQLIILYQPDRSFKQIYEEINRLNKNTLVLSGLNTDWNFLNNIQSDFSKQTTSQSEEVSGALNLNYGTFAVDDIGFKNFPPLVTEFGDLIINTANETLLEQVIDGFNSENPMLATLESNGKRIAIWDGEGIWKWRARSYLETNNFIQFDNFMGKLVQYLASNKRRSRLEVSGESFYYNNAPINITAQYFDKNFAFDSRASLTITLIETNTNRRQVLPMILKNNFYQVNLGNLDAGDYRYIVSAENEGLSRSGNLSILNYNVEQQFLNADVTKLKRLATNTSGEAFLITENQKFIKSLLENNNYQSVQKSEQKIVPLIDWKYLLALIVILLSAEWFLRKYNGLI